MCSDIFLFEKQICMDYLKNRISTMFTHTNNIGNKGTWKKVLFICKHKAYDYVIDFSFSVGGGVHNEGVG